MIESQIIASTLLSRFRVRLADPAPVNPEPLVTLRTSRPVELRLDPAPRVTGSSAEGQVLDPR